MKDFMTPLLASQLPKFSKDSFMNSSKEILATQINVFFSFLFEVYITAPLVISVKNLVRCHQSDV